MMIPNRQARSLLALLLWATLAGCAAESGLTRDERILDLESELLCLCTEGHLHPMNHPSCQTSIRDELHRMVDDGRNRAEILDAFVDKYGTAILAAPPRDGIYLVAWAAPFALLLAGGFGLSVILRNGNRQRPGTDSPNRNVSRYRERIEDEVRAYIPQD